MALPMNSILDELRCLDGEIFRSELTQRLYLLLKSQAQDLLSSLSAKERLQVLERLRVWPAEVRDEEIQTLKSKSVEVELLFAQVAMLYVKTSYKSNENRVVKIRNPRIEDLVRNFYLNLIGTPWVKNGELWTYDPIKLDFCLREQFRKAIMDSIQVIQEAAPPAQPVTKREEVYPDDSASNFLPPRDSDDETVDASDEDDATVKGKDINDGATIKRGVSFTRKDESVYSSVSNTSGKSKYASAIKPKIKPLDEPIKIILEEEDDASVQDEKKDAE